MPNKTVREALRSRIGPSTLWALVAVLSLVAAARLIATSVLVFVPYERDGAEPIVYDQAARFLRGESLYQPVNQAPYTVAAYTPLYYALAAAGRAVLGPGFWVGRLISLAAGIATTVLVASAAARIGGERRTGLLAAALFLALGMPGLVWMGVYRVDLLGVALAYGAVTCVLFGTSPRRIVLAAGLAALAFLTKPTFVAAPLAISLWVWRRDRRAAVRFAAVTAGLAGAACLAMELGTHAFIANVVLSNVNPPSLEQWRWNIEALLRHQALVLAAAAGYVLRWARSPRGEPAGLAIAYWFASLLPLVGLAKIGSYHNYWIEMAAAAAVLAALGLVRLAARWQGQRDSRLLPGLSTLLAVGLVLTVLPMGRVAAADLRHLPRALSRGAAFWPVVERVRAEPREVLALPLDVVPLSGHRILLEPLIYNIFYNENLWDARPLVERICAGDVALLVLDRPLEGEQLSYMGYALWPAPVLAALRETMVFESQIGGRWLYVPRRHCSGP